MITDPAILTGRDFSLARTLNAIIQSAGANSDATEGKRIALLQSLIDSFSITEAVNPDSQVRVRVDQRPGEAGLAPTKLLNPSDPDGMRPVALFNRFDLTPQDFSYCGEHRIVYAKGDPVSSTNRFFLIFEAAYNPVKELDLGKRQAACRSVAKFWDSLKTQTAPNIIRSLEQFYYRGLDADQDGRPEFRPVVHQDHFGIPFGQLRGNLFVTPPFLWQLREWRLTVMPDGRQSFTMATVKNNPIAELYGPKEPVDDLGTLQDKFKSVFVDNAESYAGTYLEQLTVFDRGLIDGSRNRKDELSAVLAMSVDNGFNDFQSESSGTRDEPLDQAKQGDIQQRIAAKLAPLAGCKITSTHVLNRAGAISCGGCHQFSNAKELAPGVVWPNSAGFAHVTEAGQLSKALKEEFLPARRRILDKAISASLDAVTPPVSLEIESSKSAASGNREISSGSFRRIKGLALDPLTSPRICSRRY